MRYLLTLLFAALSFSAFSQNNSIHVYPWNPDANQDNEIGMGDLLSFLSVFGEEFGLPPEPCTYDGTDFEDWIIGVLSDSIILDSVYFDLTFSDNGQYYVPGCPDPIIDTIVIYNYGMLVNGTMNGHVTGIDAWGGNVNAYIEFYEATGEMAVKLKFNNMNGLLSIPAGFFETTCSPWHLTWRGALPVDSMYASFSSDGAFDFNYLVYNPIYGGTNSTYSCNFDSYVDSIFILPYWHYADE